MTESEYREFIREQTLRHERATRSMERWMRVVERRTDEMVKRSDEIATELRSLREDFREESRAQRSALFAVLDELRAGGRPPRTA